MLRNYFLTAWRSFLKNRFYSFLNITALTTGLSVGILILLWVKDERGFDAFHKQVKSLFRLENQVGTGNSQQIWTVTAAPIGMMGKNELGEVEDVVRTADNFAFGLFKYKDQVFQETKGAFMDPAFFSMFNFPIVQGNKQNPFPDNHSLVLTRSAAVRYFGNADAIGKVIVADDSTNLTVTAIIDNFPTNTAFYYDLMMPMSLLRKIRRERSGGKENMDLDFNQFNYQTFLKLKPGTNLDALAVKLRNIHLRNKSDDTDIKYLLLPLTQMHLYKADGSDGGISTVRMFTVIALLILAIACINYVNLSTARSMIRAKEVSLRKIVGAARWHLFLQFIIETSLIFAFSALLSIGLIELLMPLFNSISGKNLVIELADPQIWKVMGLTILGTLAVSSIYPAILLSSFEPLKAMKGKLNARLNDAMFRKILVVVQFVFSVVLIVGTLVIGKQLQFIRSKELGYNKEYVFTLPMRDMGEHYDAARATLLQQPGIVDVSSSSGNVIRLGGLTGDNDWDGKLAGQTMMMHPLAIDKYYIPFFKFTMQQGENFKGSPADSMHFILNETAVRNAGIKDPLGKRFRVWKTTGTIIGVVRDFNFESIRKPIEPAVFVYAARNNFLLNVRTTGLDAKKAVAATESVFKQYNAKFPFAYSFLDDDFDSMYRSEQRTGTLFNVFAAIAILISCLGLFGLATYTAQVRTREIGVRKVLGASVGSVVGLLGKDFIRLVIIAIVIAVPVSWYAMYKWLQDFAYRIDLGWTVFLAAGLLAIGIALLTIGFQSIRAALANPVKSLRTE